MASGSEAVTKTGSIIESPFRTLHIYVRRAADLRKIEVFGKQSPYVIVECGDQSVSGAVIKSGNTWPHFDQHFIIRWSGEDTVNIRVKCDKTFGSGIRGDQCGEATVTFDPEFVSEKINVMTLNLQHDGKDAGRVYVASKFSKEPVTTSSYVQIKDGELPELPRTAQS